MSFKHEQEVRIVHFAQDQLQLGHNISTSPPTEEEKKNLQQENKKKEELKKERGRGIEIDWDVENVVEGIYVSPYCPEWYYEVILVIINKFLPSLEKKLHWSEIKKSPKF